jgi:RND family efflux transporter MFP subunit
MTATTHEAHGPENELPPRRASILRMALLAAAAIAVLAVLAVNGLRAKARQRVDRDVAATERTVDKMRVLTTIVERAPAKVEQVLPGSANPLLETAVYARTSGYLKQRFVDIGDLVTAGQLLAEIETPEVDGQLLQARAALNESRATLQRNKASAELARFNLERSRLVYEKGSGSRQDLDDADAALKVAQATVLVTEATINANQANVKRLEDLQSFQKVTAPFPGVITARNYDPGALMVADNATARELFHLSRIDILRVFADVPQTFATSIRIGQAAPVFRREAIGREYPGVVTRTTNFVDPRTRTLRVEVDVPNPDRALLPGMYLLVRFQIDAPTESVRVPGAAVITRGDGNKVAFLDSQNAIRYRPVTVGRDFGAQVEIVAGLKGGEKIVLRPGDDIAEGTVVDPISASDSR